MSQSNRPMCVCVSMPIRIVIVKWLEARSLEQEAAAAAMAHKFIKHSRDMLQHVTYILLPNRLSSSISSFLCDAPCTEYFHLRNFSWSSSSSLSHFPFAFLVNLLYTFRYQLVCTWWYIRLYFIVIFCFCFCFSLFPFIHILSRSILPLIVR